MMARISPLAAALTALTLAGCAIGPDYQRPSAALPASFDASPTRAASAAVQADWWVLFQDPMLNQLVERALSHNADVRLAVARVEQADAVAREAGAAFLPEIDGGASASKTQASTRTASYSANSPRLRTARSATLSTSYELDVWGRVRRANESVRASLLASQYARDAVRLSVAGVVSNTYLNLRALDAQLAVNQHTLRSREESLRLVRLRVDAGLSSPADAHQAESALAAVVAQGAEQRRLRAVAEHQLALLTGDPALTLAAGDVRQLPLPPLPPAGLPADLIEARPDVRQAEQQLVAANANIGVAKAGYFPKFTLTGAAGSESQTLADLFSAGAGAWSLGVSALLPILDFGRTAARVDQARALNQQALISWQNTLQVAYKEVRDALVNLREDAESEHANQRRVSHSQQALALVQLRYQAGQLGYLEVLDSQRAHDEAQLALIASRQARLGAAVDVFKALGGGWRPVGDKQG